AACARFRSWCPGCARRSTAERRRARDARGVSTAERRAPRSTAEPSQPTSVERRAVHDALRTQERKREASAVGSAQGPSNRPEVRDGLQHHLPALDLRRLGEPNVLEERAELL